VSARERLAGGAANFIDERTGAAKWMKKTLTKVFPDHWSFMLGEIVMYSFVILLLSGTFLTFWFDPSMKEVEYEGSYEPLSGVKMSAAYASTLNISFDVRGGLLMRQIHHWAALIFMAAMVIHMMRVFFTGAFRKPRELNWIIGVALLTLGIVEGFLGYSLPDDLLSGTGIRIAEAIIQAIPVVGSYLAYFAFGGAFPGEVFIQRIYTVHILLIPGIMLALITAHLMLVWYQKHTQYPGPGRTEKNVVGYPLMPVYMAKAGGIWRHCFPWSSRIDKSNMDLWSVQPRTNRSWLTARLVYGLAGWPSSPISPNRDPRLWLHHLLEYSDSWTDCSRNHFYSTRFLPIH
jgi:ubiquinol-cytochrome c reductase cytochrome b subunit